MNQEVTEIKAPVAEDIGADEKRRLQQVLVYLIAGVCLVWVFHDIHFGLMLKSMTHITWYWLALAMCLDVLGYVCQGLRWQLLLRPLGRLSVLQGVQAVYIGLFTNEILPLRVGEVVRMYLVSRWLGTKVIPIIPSMVVERLFDGIWLALAVALVMPFVPLPKDLIRGEEILIAVVLLLLLLVVYVLVREKQAFKSVSRQNMRWRPLQLLFAFIVRLADGIRTIGTSRFFFSSLGVSAFVLIFQIFSFWFMMLAYGLNFSIWIGAVVLLILHLGTVIPNAPSNVGTYQFFTVLGLSIFGVEKSVAAGFSVVAFLVLTIPLLLIGMFALSHTGMNLSTIVAEIKKMKKSE